MPVKIISLEEGPARRTTASAGATHLMDVLFACMVNPDALAMLTGNLGLWLEAIEHARTCALCQDGLASLVSLGDTPDGTFAALLAHVLAERGAGRGDGCAGEGVDGGEDGGEPADTFAAPRSASVAPSAATLASYVTLVRMSGEETAARRAPLVARHLAGCPLCRGEVSAGVAALEELLGAPAPHLAARAAWRRPRLGVWRLADALIAQAGHAGSQALSMMTASQAVRITPGYAMAGRALRDPERHPDRTPARGPASHPESQEAVFRAPTARGTRGLNVRLRLKATYTQRVSGELRLGWDGGAPGGGIAWRIAGQTLRDGGLAGQTDGAGVARFFLRQPGEFTLELEAASRRWVIPLTVAREDSK